MTQRTELLIASDHRLRADLHPASVYIASLSAGDSQRTMAAALENIAQIFGISASDFDWTKVRYQHVQAIRAALSEHYAPSTANRHMAALRGVLKEAWRLGYMDAEDYRRAIDVKRIHGERELAGRYIDSADIEALLGSCGRKKEINRRDAAIIAVLYTCGLRRDELISLMYHQYTARGLTVIGKGNKQRTVPVNAQARSLVSEWLAVRGEHDGALFTAVDKYGNVTERALTTQAVYAMLARRATAVGIEDVTPHDFRHTFISNLFDQGIDISTIANLAGHSSVEQTRQYDRRPERARVAAVDRLWIPGQA